MTFYTQSRHANRCVIFRITNYQKIQIKSTKEREIQIEGFESLLRQLEPSKDIETFLLSFRTAQLPYPARRGGNERDCLPQKNEVNQTSENAANSSDLDYYGVISMEDEILFLDKVSQNLEQDLFPYRSILEGKGEGVHIPYRHYALHNLLPYGIKDQGKVAESTEGNTSTQ